VQARAWAGIASGVLSVYAFTTIPLAECYALIFLAPLCVTILSTVILGEKVGPWRWLAVVAGFAGVMLVVRPGFRELNLGHLAAFGVAFLAATSVILMRSLAQQEKRTTMLGVLVGYGLAFNGIGAAATTFTVPDGKQLVWLVMAGAFTAGGQFLQLLAMKYAPANRVAPTALLADRLGGDPWRVVLPGIPRRADAGRPGGRRWSRPADHGARGSAAGYRALEPVFPHPALSRHRLHGDRQR
ncbi:DMT family transporter, partial [Mesorhizobium sp. M0276]